MLLGGMGVRVAKALCRIRGRSDVSYLLPNLAIGGRPGSQGIGRERMDSILDLTPELGPMPLGGIEYLKLPVKNGHSPAQDQMLPILDWIHERIDGGKKVLVHCSLGRGRATFVAACYLMQRHGMTAAEAFKTVKSRRRYAHLNRRQVRSLIQFEEYLKARVVAP